MPLNLELVGKKTDPMPFKYDQDTVILYALGVGAGLDELNFVYEKNLKVLPTFAVIPIHSCMDSLMRRSGMHMPAVLHGGQEIILHDVIPVAGTLYNVAQWKSVYDKGDKGAILNFSTRTHDREQRLIFENRIVLVDRSAGNFGGERGPKTERIDPPEGIAPDFQETYDIPRAQAAVYRLSGDKNPLHIDPEFAAKGELPRPVLHGLCSYGYAGRAIIRNACGGDPAKLTYFSTRFLNVVFPGETIVVQGWRREAGKYIVQVKTSDGRIVLGNSIARLS